MGECGYGSMHFIFRARWVWLLSLTPRSLYPQRQSHRYLMKRRLGGPQSWPWRNGEENNLCIRQQLSSESPVPPTCRLVNTFHELEYTCVLNGTSFSMNITVNFVGGYVFVWSTKCCYKLLAKAFLCYFFAWGVSSEDACVNVNKFVFYFVHSSVIGTQPSIVETLRPECNKENLLREGWLHCKITLVDGKVINFISKSEL